MKVFDDVDYRERKAEVIKTNANKPAIPARPRFQVAILSERINNLTGTSRPT